MFKLTLADFQLLLRVDFPCVLVPQAMGGVLLNLILIDFHVKIILKLSSVLLDWHRNLGFNLSISAVHNLIVLKLVSYLFLTISYARVLFRAALIKLIAINDSYLQILALLFAARIMSSRLSRRIKYLL